MKKQILTMGLLATAFAAEAQTVVTDTVSQGNGYAKQVWYSLENDTIGTHVRGDWDLAFQIFGGGTASILINNYAGSANPQTSVWTYRKGNASVFGTALDTNGLYTWPKMYNDEKKWEVGGFGASVGMNLGWGNYNPATHDIVGDSVYIVKTIGGTYKQLIIDSLTGGTYIFKYANLDGTNKVRQTLAKSAYPKKNFGYFSIDNNIAIDREPDSSGAWDLFFCQYMASDYSISAGMQGVTAVLHNMGVKVAEVKFKDSATAAADTNQVNRTYVADINVIGWDWKALNASFSGYNIKDSVAYFIQTKKKDVWKVIFTGFGGNTDGNYIFTKQKVYTYIAPNSVKDIAVQNTTLAVFPNPARGGEELNILYSHEASVSAARLVVTDMTGRTVVNTAISTDTQLHQFRMPVALQAGTYIVNIVTDKGTVTQKLSIN